jgi:hypothetical protein
MSRRRNKTASRTSPSSSKRACLCKDNTYSRKCCDGSLQAQGIGNIHADLTSFLLQEDLSFILQENNSKIII